MLLFFNVGRGTIMPWDPTRELVAVGPYQYMRNPIIAGVIAILVGEAFFFGSGALGIWAMAAFLVNHVYFIYSEELGWKSDSVKAIANISGGCRAGFPNLQENKSGPWARSIIRFPRS